LCSSVPSPAAESRHSFVPSATRATFTRSPLKQTALAKRRTLSSTSHGVAQRTRRHTQLVLVSDATSLRVTEGQIYYLRSVFWATETNRATLAHPTSRRFGTIKYRDRSLSFCFSTAPPEHEPRGKQESRREDNIRTDRTETGGVAEMAMHRPLFSSRPESCAACGREDPLGVKSS
jgi:hypothetical protein